MRRPRMPSARFIDDVAHILYCPTMGRQGCVRARWHHHFHLIPGRLLAVACDRYDRALGVYDED